MTSQANPPTAAIEKVGKLPKASVRLAREIAQKEVESDVRAHESLMARANSLLGWMGASMLGFFFGMRQSPTSVCTKIIWCVALLAAGATLTSLFFGTRVRSTATQLNDDNIAGIDLDAATVGISQDDSAEKKESKWDIAYERSLVRAYFELRSKLKERHEARATWVERAQLSFFVFVCLMLFLVLSKGFHMPSEPGSKPSTPSAPAPAAPSHSDVPTPTQNPWDGPVPPVKPPVHRKDDNR